MRIYIITLFLAIMCATYLFNSFKNKKYESILILIPAFTIILYQTDLTNNFSYSQRKVVGIVNAISIFLILFYSCMKKQKS